MGQIDGPISNPYGVGFVFLETVLLIKNHIPAGHAGSLHHFNELGHLVGAHGLK